MSPSKRKVEAGTGIEERLGRGDKKAREDKGKGRAVAGDDGDGRPHPSPGPANAQPRGAGQQQSTVPSTLQDGRPPGVVVKELPHDYIAADAEDLILLIGAPPFAYSRLALGSEVLTVPRAHLPPASMLTKLIGHNDQVPLRPCVARGKFRLFASAWR
jgi:hypothetical protein